MKEFFRREWLNVEGSSSTGSITVMDKMKQHRYDKDTERTLWVEFADCQRKISLHKIYEDTEEQYINKIRKIKEVIDEYLEHLESNKENTKELNK